MRRAARRLPIAAAVLWLSVGAGHAAPELPLLAYKPDINPQAFLPISYSCPPGKTGVVEVVKISGVGARIRVRVSFDGETVTHALVQRAVRGRPFELWHEFTTPRKRPENEAERSVWQAALSEADAVRLAICSGIPANREKYDKILEYNRQHLKPPPD